jgi:hypothetical protein
VRLTELLAREGAPWRPFEDQGILVTAQKKPRDAKAIFAACEKTLVSHLKAVCLWPEKGRDDSWRIGDYAFYWLSFEAAPKTFVYVQIWSEPDQDGAVDFEVSSGQYDEAINQYIDANRQELIREHGFEIGESAKNFLKCIAVHNTRHARALGREFIAILCNALGYNGTQELTYRLYLGTNTRPGFVFRAIGADDLAKLMHRLGFVADLKPREEGKPRVIESRTDHGAFAVFLLDEKSESWRLFQRITLRAFRKVSAGDGLGVVNLINRRFSSLQASIDDDGDLLLESTILLHGGVTAEHLEKRFELWRWMIGEIAAG